jgi:hypothetical protein
MEFGNAWVASVYQAHLLGAKRNSVLLEKTKIMDSSFAKRGANNQSAQIINPDLSFEGVALLLTTVERTLFFWGRSIARSVPSISNTQFWTSNVSRRTPHLRLNNLGVVYLGVRTLTSSLTATLLLLYSDSVSTHQDSCRRSIESRPRSHSPNCPVTTQLLTDG